MQNILLAIFIIFLSCNNRNQKAGITHQIKKSNLPIKFEVASSNYQQRDSSYVYFYIPQVFDLSNNYENSIYIEDAYFSISGANIVDGVTLNYEKSSLKSSISGFNMLEKETKKLKIHTRFKRIISKTELEELKNIFGKDFKKRVIYDLEITSSIRKFLDTKIPNKGFTHFTLYNKKTKKRFFYNVPFDF